MIFILLFFWYTYITNEHLFLINTFNHALAFIKMNFNQYIEREKRRGQEIHKDLLDDDYVIRSAKSLYPEYDLKEPFGLHRPGVNLASMLFIYPQVVVYVPALTKVQFPERYGISYESFLQLMEAKFLYPLLNHPRKYTKEPIKSEISEILLRMPPTWDRWHSALEISGGNKWFDEADKHFEYSDFWNINELRQLWASRLRTNNGAIISKEIKQQIRNNYVNLCLVGRQEEANRIAELSRKDSEQALNELYYSSDYYAYPSVMGAGGMANIRIPKSAQILRYKEISRKAGFGGELEHFDGKVLESLLEGLKFNQLPKQVHIDFLINWHKSEQAKIARQAYATLMKLARNRNPNYESLHYSVNSILAQLEEFTINAEPEIDKKIATKEKIQKGVNITCTVGGLASTILGLFYFEVYMAIIGGSLTILGTFNLTKRKRIAEKLIQSYAPGVSLEVFEDYKKLREFRNRYLTDRSIMELPSPNIASSAPINNYWWEE